jgi:hypothetical protein
MKINIKWKAVIVSAFLVTIGFLKTGAAQQKFDKSVFYDVIASGDTDAINNQLTIVEEASLNNKKGYNGALLMKKAGLLTKPKEKLKLFKMGRIKMETALLADTKNTEFHFLRLAIEEHAPKIVKYHADIEKDKLFIQKNFKNLSPVVQRAILDYCKNSKVLHKDSL